MPEEALFGGDEKSVVNGKFNSDLDRRPVASSGHTITRLDGSAIYWRMGERLPFKFANGKTLNLRPASFVVLGMLTKIAREHYEKILSVETNGEAEGNAIKQMRDLAYDRKELSNTGRFLTAQMIFLDATDDEKLLRWKKDKRQPNDEELAAALPRDEYDYDYTGVEIDDLIHVYYQLNFLPTVEKKGFLNLMIP